MHRAHRAENHSLRLSLSPFSGLSSFLPWLAPSCYKKVFPSTVSRSQGPFQPTGQEVRSDFKGVLSAAATVSARRDGEDGGTGMLRCRHALGSQGTGHSRSFCSKHGPCCTCNHPPGPGQCCSAARLSAPTTCNPRRRTSQVHAPHCAPGGPVPALLDLQSFPCCSSKPPLTAAQASPVQKQAQHLLLHQFPSSTAHRHQSTSPHSCGR